MPSSASSRMPAWLNLLLLGIQHVMVMYTGAVAVPLVLGTALHMDKPTIALLINADLFCCGVVTLIQTVGFWKVGIRLPVMMGVTFVSMGPMIAIGSTPGEGLRYIFGAAIIAGIFGFLVAPLVGRLRRLFPPIVTGCTIICVGFSLMGVAVTWAAGGAGNPDAGSLSYLAIAALVMVMVVMLIKYTRGFINNISILLGLVVGYLVSSAMGLVSLHGIGSEPAMRLVMPFNFGTPIFSLWPAVAMCVVMLVSFIESTGMYLALGEIIDKDVNRRELVRGYRADGLGTIFGGIFNTFPYTSFAQNVGLVAVTGVRSRWVCATAGGLLVLLSLFPQLAFVVASVPSFVIGGVGIIMFGMVAANGIKILGQENLNDTRNLYIISISLGLGFIPVVYPHFFDQFPSELAPILKSPILLTAASAILLTLFFQQHKIARQPDAGKSQE